MDDFNANVLSEAKSEYSSRLITILVPLVLEGIKSIFKEAYELCTNNEQHDKYLMTFQNFLTRVPRWNQEIINEETKRILDRSSCPYLEDILTCVHITQLKILTSIRVSSKQKKVNIDIPKLPDFIHKVYIACARKIYENVYLFEANIAPLQQQKNMRECEIICRESIIGVIQSTMPIEQILRAYIDEVEEEEVVEETTQTKAEPQAVADISANVAAASDNRVDKELNVNKSEQTAPIEKKPAVTETVVPKTDRTVEAVSEKDPRDLPKEIDTSPFKSERRERVVSSREKVPVVMKVETETSPKVVEAAPPSSKLTFSNKDEVIEYSGKDRVTRIKAKDSKEMSAPKTLERLEAISAARHEERKVEPDNFGDDERLTIHSDGPSVKLGAMDIQVLDKNIELNDKPLLTGVETLQ